MFRTIPTLASRQPLPAAVLRPEPRPHPQLSVGDAHTVSDAEVVFSIRTPGQDLPDWVADRLAAEEKGASTQTFCAAFDATSEAGVGTPYRRRHFEHAWAPAFAALDAGARVHVHCGSGRVRSSSVALVLLAHLERDLDGPALVQRLIDLNPAMLGGLEGRGDRIDLLRGAYRDAARQHPGRLGSLPSASNLSWI